MTLSHSKLLLSASSSSIHGPWRWAAQKRWRSTS